MYKNGHSYTSFKNVNAKEGIVRFGAVLSAALAGTDDMAIYTRGTSLYFWNGTAETEVGAGGGDITAVVAGAGLTGGSESGSATINVINTDGKITVGANSIDITANTLVNADIKTTAAIAYSKLAALTSNYMLAGVGGVATVCSVAGDVTMTATGTTATYAIAGDSIIDADVKTTAAIAYSKLAALASANVLIGSAGNVATVTAITGDVALTNAGVTTVTDLTITSEAAGDILYFNGTNWIRLAKPGASDLYLEGGTTPAWSAVSAGIASSLAQSVTAEAGTNDYTIAFTTLTSSASTLTIPDMAGANGTFAFINKAQTWTTNQIVAYGHLLLGDSDDGQTLQILVNENMTGDRTLTILPNDANRSISLAGDVTLSGALLTVGDDSVTFTTSAATDVTLPTTGTLATLTGSETLTNKTLTTPKIATTGSITDAGGSAYLTFVEDATPRDSFQITTGDATVGAKLEVITADTNANFIVDAAGTGDFQIANGTELTFLRATQNALVVVADQTGEDHTFNIPDIATGAADTFAFLAEAQTLTNKTIDVDANTVTNINATELDPVGDVAFGIPFLYRVDVTNVTGDTTVVSNSAFKFRVIDAWSVNTTANGGVWSLKTDSGKMTSDITVAANDTDIDRPTQILDDMADVAATTGDLYVTSDATLDATIYILCLRID